MQCQAEYGGRYAAAARAASDQGYQPFSDNWDIYRLQRTGDLRPGQKLEDAFGPAGTLLDEVIVLPDFFPQPAARVLQLLQGLIKSGKLVRPKPGRGKNYCHAQLLHLWLKEMPQAALASADSDVAEAVKLLRELLALVTAEDRHATNVYILVYPPKTGRGPQHVDLEPYGFRLIVNLGSSSK